MRIWPLSANFLSNLDITSREEFRSAATSVVRTPEEFRAGHIRGALNIPLDSLITNIDTLQKKGKAVITCCKSGARSNSAAGLLYKAGVEVYDGGGWSSLERSIR
jgi:rhodanese-related sulfurtransferase